ncbi:MAG: alpha/beta fold hydrolase, partial [Mycobacterium sp.]
RETILRIPKFRIPKYLEVVVASQRIPTAVGDLHVESDGAGPPAVLWHSLFVDSTSFELLRPLLAHRRSLIVIDGPGHGRSGASPGPFTLADCARAAVVVLDRRGISGPVDWVGNAWGGHVGLTLAADAPQRIRSLVTIGTPVQAISASERLRQIYPLVALYRVVGPIGFTTRALTDALLGAQAVTAQPELARRVIDAFRRADRRGMFTAMCSAMLRRKAFTRLGEVAAPTLMIAGRDDPTWNVAMAAAAVAQMPVATSMPSGGAGHVAPLLLNPDFLGRVIAEFWAAPAEHIRSHASAGT